MRRKLTFDVDPPVPNITARLARIRISLSWCMATTPRTGPLVGSLRISLVILCSSKKTTPFFLAESIKGCIKPLPVDMVF